MTQKTNEDATTSLLDEIEQLQIIEAEQLQEGVAFHAFQFKMATALETLELKVNGRAEKLADALKLPAGAHLLDVVDDTMRVMFDPSEVKPRELKEMVEKSLSGKVAGIEHDEKSRIKLAGFRRG